MSNWHAQVRKIERKADEVLRRAGVSSPPAPVERIAENEGLQVRSSTFSEEVSGLLSMEGDTPTIGYNRLHPTVRQRFTIAHEIGHYLLHGDKSELFVDKGYSNIIYRDSRSSDAKYTREIQANAFAAALLMPKEMLLEEVEKLDFDLAEEDSLSELADLFQVSRQAMAYRLDNSGIFSSAPDHLE